MWVGIQGVMCYGYAIIAVLLARGLWAFGREEGFWSVERGELRIECRVVGDLWQVQRDGGLGEGAGLTGRTLFGSREGTFEPMRECSHRTSSSSGWWRVDGRTEKR